MKHSPHLIYGHMAKDHLDKEMEETCYHHFMGYSF